LALGKIFLFDFGHSSRVQGQAQLYPVTDVVDTCLWYSETQLGDIGHIITASVHAETIVGFIIIVISEIFLSALHFGIF